MTIEKQLELITPKILPVGFSFLDQQKAAIFADKSTNIVAGPGSGKTTVLITKCALLMKATNLSSKGICLITHTNVAVDEIKMGLSRIGVKNIEYPHFVGTIQEFFNTFFSKKAFHQIIKDKQFRVLDDDEYREKFDELFEKYKPSFYTYSNYPNVNKANPKLMIDNKGKFDITSNAKSSYKSEFEKCIRILFKAGLLNNQQCLELANWYIIKHQEPLKKALATRFSYVLLDEAQDTSINQYELLMKLMTDNDIIFQKFGDPYQALYNIFEGNHDAWIPREESNYDYEEISETTRFGTSIASIVKNVCIEQYHTFKSNDSTESFDPYYIFYDNEDDLIEQYHGLITACSKESQIFSSSKKKDAIVAAFHDDLLQLFSNYKKTTTKIKKNESSTRQIINFIVGLLSKELEIPFRELKESIFTSHVCKIKLSFCIKELVSDNSQTEILVRTLKEILSIITSNEKSDFSLVDVIEQVEYFKGILNLDLPSELHEEENNFYIGTIHSVKGETHRSTLLMLSSSFIEYVDREVSLKFHIFDLLKEYLTGNYIDPNTIKDLSLRNETIKSLKLAYVALSRPSHLLVIAIPKYFEEQNTNIFTRMDSFGWKKYDQGVLV
ncbi:UvrD-helicase domain-containing protein [Sporosarcina sp. USHLN248]|uniref:UvrD-helicase domain-containing protein n=1 Tax=Sporosarcina sp. USHLN248 TaxID=3081300 RepID=UPI00301695F4